MKIHIDQIPESGITLSEEYGSGALDLNREDAKFTEPINLSAQVTKGINNISVNLKIDGTIHLSCSRCLDEFTKELSKEVKLNILIENQDEIDLTDNLREEIILSYPSKPLCQDSCCGLCPVCGKNLNKEKCNCKGKNTYS